MKKDTHPKYFKNAKATCACGNEFSIGSTREELKVELCHLCHPFYTGKQKLVDSARRVEKYEEKLAKQAEAAKGRKGKKVKNEARKAKQPKKEK